MPPRGASVDNCLVLVRMLRAEQSLLYPAIQNALDDGGFVELEQVRHLPGMTRAVLRTLRKIWAADFDLAAAGGAGHRRIAEMSLIEARLRSTLASAAMMPRDLRDAALKPAAACIILSIAPIPLWHLPPVQACSLLRHPYLLTRT